MTDRHTRMSLARRVPGKGARRAAKLKAERDQWQHAAGVNLLRAEALEDRLKNVERERDTIQIKFDDMTRERDALLIENEQLKRDRS